MALYGTTPSPARPILKGCMYSGLVHAALPSGFGRFRLSRSALNAAMFSRRCALAVPRVTFIGLNPLIRLFFVFVLISFFPLSPSCAFR